jgi:prepilin-type N-terminal cleavage/methylation domain-containing protein/prepilin-type processing-associated H-X9-DG protein
MRRDVRAGFTLVELLVVIGIILVLVGMLLPALSKVRRQTNITACAANLHDIGAALIIYAADNRGSLPQFNPHPTATNPGAPGGAWLWDVEVGMRDALVDAGAHRGNLYCPVQADQQDSNLLWDYHDSNPNSEITGLSANSDGSVSGFAVMGYFFLTLRAEPDATSGYPDVTPSLWFTPASDPKFTSAIANGLGTWRYQKTIVANNTGCVPYRTSVAAETEIVTDATADDGTGNFGNIKGGYIFPHQSAHWFGGLPIGGNILFLDGHVANRGFKASSIPGPNADVNNADIMHWRCSSGNIRFYF